MGSGAERHHRHFDERVGIEPGKGKTRERGKEKGKGGTTVDHDPPPGD